MYLSKIELDPIKYKTRRAILSPEVFHAAIEKCFCEKPNGDERNLWRMDSIGGKLHLLILSPVKPDFTRFIEQFCISGTSGETRDYDVLLNKLQPGQRWRFRLRGNATSSSSQGEGKRGKVLAHNSIKYQREWLCKKAIKCGFALDNDLYNVVGKDKLGFQRTGQIAPVSLGVAVFEGELTITDVDLFRNALTHGIGRAKAYGCGLLTIASPRVAPMADQSIN